MERNTPGIDEKLMIRFVKQDYDRLQAYIKNYALLSDLGSKAREELLKRLHKHSLALLQICAVVERLAAADGLALSGQHLRSDSLNILQIGECVSDMIDALFSSMHGLYKPAHMSLRSAIENFVRGLAGLFSAEARDTTSVYRLFEVAELEVPFRGSAAPHFRKLNVQYGELCLFTHSATPAHMMQNFALANLPRHDTRQLRGLVRHFETIAKAVLAVMVLANRDLYLQVPPSARELLDELLPTDIKVHALGG